jgi:S1-C subfamily serine protease
MWYVKDLYGQIIDSTLVTSFSGEFTTIYLKKHHSDEFEYTVIKDAIENNFIDFKNTKTFTKHAKIETGVASTDRPFGLTRPTSIVQSIKDAGDATVIVKRKGDKERGHGSGFAITNDGYILTNYHVIAGKQAGKPCEVSVITVTGLEIPAKVVRFNEKTDVALLKVDKQFEKCFALSSKKRYDRHDDCYTIGAPTSIELGQSVSRGLISNERETKTGKLLLQLNMNISPGNSGGAVFSNTGQLYGIVVSKLVGSYTEGVCFAIPSHLVGKYLNIGYKRAN